MFRIHGLCARTTHRRSSGFNSNCLDRGSRKPTAVGLVAGRRDEALKDGGIGGVVRPVMVTVRVEGMVTMVGRRELRGH